MTKCIIYARFSPRPDEATSDANEKQIESCMDYAHEQGWEIVAVHQDKAKSRDDAEREGIADAIQALKQGMVLLCYDSSRFGSGAAAVFYEDRITRKKARLAFVQGGTMDDSPEARLLREILYAFNQYQKIMIGARTRAKMRKKQADGHICSKVLPYGYKRDPHNPKMMIPDGDEQQAIKLMKDLRKEGRSYGYITRELTQLKAPARNKNWHKSTVKRVLDRAAERHT